MNTPPPPSGPPPHQRSTSDTPPPPSGPPPHQRSTSARTRRKVDPPPSMKPAAQGPAVHAGGHEVLVTAEEPSIHTALWSGWMMACSVGRTVLVERDQPVVGKAARAHNTERCRADTVSS
eukprot:1191791-Prorocentrum_minimum.AAC.2